MVPEGTRKSCTASAIVDPYASCRGTIGASYTGSYRPFEYTEREDAPTDELMRNREPQSSGLPHTCRGEIRRRRRLRPVCARRVYRLTLAVLGFRTRGARRPRRRVLSEQSERTSRAFIYLFVWWARRRHRPQGRTRRYVACTHVRAHRVCAAGTSGPPMPPAAMGAP